jgi:hypothetical protein
VLKIGKDASREDLQKEGAAMSNVERRKHARKSVEENALIHINTPKGSIEKSVKIDNISFGGICLKNLNDIENEAKGHYLEGRIAAVYFRSTPVSVFGVVARQESGGILAVRIKHTTDDGLWGELNS